MTSFFSSFVSKVKELAQSQFDDEHDVASLVPTTSRRNLDVTVLTPQLLISSQPMSALHPTYEDTGRKEPPRKLHTPNPGSDTATVPSPDRQGTCPMALAQFLAARKQQHLLVNLSDEPPDDRSNTLLQRQIVTVGGWTTTVPTLETVLHVCYVLSAWLEHDHHDTTVNTHVDNPTTATAAVLYCRNGKTRCSIAATCWLRFSGQVETCKEGFD